MKNNLKAATTWFRTNFSFFSFILGCLVVLVIIVLINLNRKKEDPLSVGILDSDKLKYNVVVPRREVEGENNPLANFEKYHRDINSRHRRIYTTYYITKEGFRDIVDSSIFDGLRIDFGCNGLTGGKHKYGLYFSGRASKAIAKPTNTKDPFQYFAPIYNEQGLRTTEEGYLNKTCPCPLQGTKCPCEN